MTRAFTAAERVALLITLTGLCAARPAEGQRLADLAPVYVARPALAPTAYGECKITTRAMWAGAGAIVGAMTAVLVFAVTTWRWDAGPSAAGRRELALFVGAGLLAGGVYGWFVLADRFVCG